MKCIIKTAHRSRSRVFIVTCESIHSRSPQFRIVPPMILHIFIRHNNIKSNQIKIICESYAWTLATSSMFTFSFFLCFDFGFFEVRHLEFDGVNSKVFFPLSVHSFIHSRFVRRRLSRFLIQSCMELIRWWAAKANTSPEFNWKWRMCILIFMICNLVDHTVATEKLTYFLNLDWSLCYFFVPILNRCVSFHFILFYFNVFFPSHLQIHGEMNAFN